MATGDDALAAGMDLVPGSTAANTIHTEIDKTRDYIAQRTNAVTPIANGGTNADTAAGARVNLGVQATVDDVAAAVATIEADKLVRANGAGQIAVPSPAYTTSPTPRSYVDTATGGKVSKSGDTMSGHLYVPNAVPATTSYVVAYINSDGRLSKGASSEKYKKFIGALDPRKLGNLFLDFKRFKMRGGDDVWRYGYTAEQLAANPDTEQFVIYLRDVETDDDGNVTGAPHLQRDESGAPIPESIDFIGLLLAQVAQLNARVVALEGKE